MTKNEIKLGQKITVTNCLERKRLRTSKYGKDFLKEWKLKELKEPKEVVIVGIRTLSNGTTTYDPDCGWLYSHDNSFTALMVVNTLYSKPFFVPLEQ